MPGYTTVGTNNPAKSLPFYDELLAMIGMAPLFDHPSGGRIYGTPATGTFGVLVPHDGKPATVGNGSMTGFFVESPEKVAELHAKALELGGTCEGKPGERVPGAHFAYFRDLDGNKLCAYHFGG